MKTLTDSFRHIRETYKKVSSNGVNIKSKAQEWLADNFYILEQEEEQIRSAFKAADKRQITFEGGESRTYIMARELVRAKKIMIDGQTLAAYLKEMAAEKRLSTEEIKIFLSETKCAIFEEIKEVCSRIDKESAGDDAAINMANSIKSLIALKDVDWGEEFYNISPLEEILAGDNAGVYPSLSLETKEVYRRAISALAKKSGKDETYIARCAVLFSQKGEGRSAHVGYYLIDDGRVDFKKYLGIKNKMKIKAPLVYMGAIFALTSATQTIIYFYTKSIWAGFWSGIPLFDIWRHVINWFCTRFIKPRALPYINLKNKIPDEGRTMIVYPVLLASAKDAVKMAKKIEVCYSANRDDNLKFALLGDFKDGESEQAAGDEEIISAAATEIEKLNKKYGDRFFFFHRGREYNAVQKKWMGYERKRGALISLNRFLRGKGTFMHITGNTDTLSGIKYVITLDGDTILPLGSAKKLIGAAIHPLNRAVIDEKSGIVKKGYGIIAPRISVDIDSANKTLFSRIFAGQGGVDTYSTSVSDIYMDLAGEAVFTGKGLYDIDIFEKCIENKIPDNTVLSHDLLESCFARCGYFSSVEVFDSYPATYISNSDRYHRWIRGDWQLLPWLLFRVHNKNGEIIKNHINYLSKWKIGDNLRRSILPVFQFILIVGAICVFKMSGLWLGISLLSICMPMFFYLISSLFSKSFFYVGEKRNSNIIYGFKSWLYQVTLTIMFLPHTAYISADAIIRTLIRVLFTGKNTLEWVTAAEAERKNKNSIMYYYRKMSPSVVAAAGILYFCAFLSVHNIGVALIFAAVWGLAPMCAYIIGRRGEWESHLPQKGEEFLKDTARRIWRFFDEYMREGDNFLPPDNIQMSPYKGVAHRTSPTNIGLGMMTVLGAADMGFITPAKMAEKLEKTITSVEKADKWRGHLYNWYDTKTLKPLMPRYVSTVDSGNLLCYLMVVKKGVLDYKDKIGDAAEKIAARIDKICSNMSFTELFDKKKKLFYIGYNVEEDRFSSSYYDLLASEVRQSVFLSIARGEVSKDAWFKLGRSLAASDGYRGLLSWTGTMFEYLMPLLIMETSQNTLLSETYFFAVHCNKKYAFKRRVPWGISESGYIETDVAQNYKYKAFGTPVLGIKRGLAEDTVISPYSSLLALMVDKRAAYLNLIHLKRQGAMGEYGFYEAVDYTKSRTGGSGRVVKSYMAHHQGMSFISILNVLYDNIMQKRFSSYPEVKAAMPLLWERVPVKIPIKKDVYGQKRTKNEKPQWAVKEDMVRGYKDKKSSLPQINAMSNGAYSVVIDTFGSGYSALEDIRLNKFEAYNINEKTGQRIFVRDIKTGRIYDAYMGECIFSPYMAEYKTQNDEISLNLKICVSPDEGGEGRRLVIVNNTKEERQFEVVYYTELSLADYGAESAHRAFSDLFIKTFYENGVLYATRRARGGERTCTAYLGVVAKDDGKILYETDRAAFLGRGNTVDTADMLLGNAQFSASPSGGINPCFAFSVNITIDGGESDAVTFVSGIGENTPAAKSAAGRLLKSAQGDMFESPDRYFADEYAGLYEGDTAEFTAALPSLIYGGYAHADTADAIMKNRLPREEIWKMGISGDYPIVLLRAEWEEDKNLVQKMIRAYKFWRIKGILCDLAIVCADSGYQNSVFDMVKDEIKKSAPEAEDIRAGIRALSAKYLSNEDITLLTAISRLYVSSAQGGIKGAVINPQKNCLPPHKNAKTDDGEIKGHFEFYNGFGGFDTEKDEYVIKQNMRGETPAPWINVIANPTFGFIAGESGGGYTWHKNSRENRLTMWHNDSISDPVTEKLIIKNGDDEYSPMAGVFADEGIFYTKHGKGYTKYVRITRGIEHEVTMFVPTDENVKIIAIRLKNTLDKTAKLNICYKTCPVMGNNLSKERGNLVANIVGGNTVTVKNAFSKNGEYMFLSASGGIGEIYDSSANKKCAHPISGIVPEITVSKEHEIAPGKTVWAFFTLGASNSEEGCKSLADKYLEKEAVLKAFSDTATYWKRLCGGIKVRTGDGKLDIMLSGYLTYQAIACRMFARSAHYQSGGAFGFRDQLQDSMAALYCAPELAREHIIYCAAHQFEMGDVLHWWHPSLSGGMPRGVRTRFSDDRLWLAFVTAEYMRITGDESILDETAHFAFGDELLPGEGERYITISGQGNSASIYEHIVRAIDISLARGRHFLPLIGGGDWNDGMNLVGIDGEGESVWLTWFLLDILKKFIPICEIRGDRLRVKRYKKEIESLKTAVEENAWDGEWYCRAFFDDGTPIGSGKNAECRIDSISQSWATLSGAGDKERIKAALASAEKMLCDKQNNIIKLLSPPFEKSDPSPGYIQSYLPGIRENGGQYTHAAVWLAMAYSVMGDNDKAMEFYNMLCPITHSETKILANIYKAEPYVMAADIYSVPPLTGRGGWTWYTGAAVWMQKLGLECILGFKKVGDTVSFEGKMPQTINEYEIEYTFGETKYIFNVKRGKGKNEIKMTDDKKEHRVNVFRE